MIAAKDIDNVKSIIEKSRELASTEFEKRKYDKLFRDLTKAGNEYLEVIQDVRLS